MSGAAPPAVGTPTALPNAPAPAPKVAVPKPVAPKPVAAPEAAEAPKAAAPPDETLAEKRIRLKYKQGGKEIDRDFTPDEITRKLQLAEGSAERGRKADELEAREKTRTETLKKRGLAAMREEAKALGIEDFDAQIENDVLERFKQKHKANEKGEWEERSPEEIELEDLRQFKKATAEADEKRVAAERVAAEEREAQALSDRFAKEITPITKALGYTEDYTRLAVVPAIRDVFDAADAAGVTLTTAQATAEAKELLDWKAQEHFTNMDDPTFSKIMSDRVKGAPAERLIAMLGPEAIDKILEHTVAELRGGAGAPKPAEERAEKPKRRTDEETMEIQRNALVFGQRRMG